MNQIILSSLFQNMTGRQRITGNRSECSPGCMLKPYEAGARPHREGDGSVAITKTARRA